MAANAGEQILLRGYPTTGVTLVSQQLFLTDGYGTPTDAPAPGATCAFVMATTNDGGYGSTTNENTFTSATTRTGRYGSSTTC